MSDIKILFSYLVFLGFAIQIISMGAPNFISGEAPYVPEPPTCEIGVPEDVEPSNWWDDIIRGAFNIPVISQAMILLQLITCAWNNITFFFTLMQYSSTITLISVILFVPFGIIIVWIILKLLMGAVR